MLGKLRCRRDFVGLLASLKELTPDFHMALSAMVESESQGVMAQDIEVNSCRISREIVAALWGSLRQSYQRNQISTLLLQTPAATFFTDSLTILSRSALGSGEAPGRNGGQSLSATDTAEADKVNIKSNKNDNSNSNSNSATTTTTTPTAAAAAATATAPTPWILMVGGDVDEHCCCYDGC